MRLHQLQIDNLDVILGIDNKSQSFLTAWLCRHALDHVDALLIGNLSKAAIRLCFRALRTRAVVAHIIQSGDVESRTTWSTCIAQSIAVMGEVGVILLES